MLPQKTFLYYNVIKCSILTVELVRYTSWVFKILIILDSIEPVSPIFSYMPSYQQGVFCQQLLLNGIENIALDPMQEYI